MSKRVCCDLCVCVQLVSTPWVQKATGLAKAAQEFFTALNCWVEFNVRPRTGDPKTLHSLARLINKLISSGHLAMSTICGLRDEASRMMLFN